MDIDRQRTERSPHTFRMAESVRMKCLSASPLFLVFPAAPARASRTTPADHPNVLILFTDDRRYSTVAALDSDEIQAPNMDRLAAMGTAFTRAFVEGGQHGAICAPSRAARVASWRRRSVTCCGSLGGAS